MFARFVFAVAVVLSAAYVATNASAAPAPSWRAISEFYSGGNLSGEIGCSWTNTDGTTGMPGSGHVNLNPRVCASLAALRRYGARSQRGMVLGALGLSVLIHESLHNRVQPGWDNADEVVIGDLGWRLIPDAMQRFWGIQPDSYWGQRYQRMVLKTLGG